MSLEFNHSFFNIFDYFQLVTEYYIVQKFLIFQIQEFQSTKQKLSSEMVDNSNMILNLVVRAEDARILGDM